jgi:hypothetical protein
MFRALARLRMQPCSIDVPAIKDLANERSVAAEVVQHLVQLAPQP